MTGVDLGATTTVSWRLGTASQTVVLTVTQPDGTTLTPAVTDDEGIYSAAVPSAFAGRYLLSWTKAAAPAAAYTDILDVWPADPRFLISLDDARSSLRLSASIASLDQDLRLYIAACTPVIEDLAGDILTNTRTEIADGGRPQINLLAFPNDDGDVTVTIDGVALAESAFVVDRQAAIVYAAGGHFPAGRQNVTITYATGSSVIAPNIRLATKELLRHMWQVGQQASRPAFGDDPSDEPVEKTPMGFAVPRRVIELCASVPRLPGIA